MKKLLLKCILMGNLIFLIILISFNISLSYVFSPALDNIQFENFDVNDGLSQSALTSILQDSKGFLWIGSGDGLNRYDGKTFAIFYSDRTDSTALSSSLISKLLEDSEGCIWVATENGLNRFDWSTETFKQFLHSADDTNSLCDNAIWDIEEDSEGNLWIATDVGLSRYSRTTQKFKNFFFSAGSVDSIEIISLYFDKRSNLYLGTFYGYYRLNIYTLQYDHFYIDKKDTLNSPKNFVHEFNIDKNGDLWLGTKNGLFKLLSNGGYKYFPLTKLRGAAVDVRKIIFTDDNKAWIGTYGSGLFLVDLETGNYKQWRHDPYRRESLIYDYISDMTIDRSDILWIATNLGLAKLDLDESKFTIYNFYPGCKNCLSDNTVWAIYEDDQGNLWIGTDRGGVNKYNPRQNKFSYLKYIPKEKNTSLCNSVIAIARDSTDMLWFAAFNYGVAVFDPDNKKFTHY